MRHGYQRVTVQGVRCGRLVASLARAQRAAPSPHAAPVLTGAEQPLENFRNAVCGACVSIVFIVGAFPLLWWNEGARAAAGTLSPRT